jgi:hypothetical protein
MKVRMRFVVLIPIPHRHDLASCLTGFYSDLTRLTLKRIGWSDDDYMVTCMDWCVPRVIPGVFTLDFAGTYPFHSVCCP